MIALSKSAMYEKIPPAQKKGARGSVIEFSFLLLLESLIHSPAITARVREMTLRIAPRGVPSTKPQAAINFISPPPIEKQLSLCIRIAARKYGSPVITSPENAFQGSIANNPVIIRSNEIVSGISRFRTSHAAAKMSRKANIPPFIIRIIIALILPQFLGESPALRFHTRHNSLP